MDVFEAIRTIRTIIAAATKAILDIPDEVHTFAMIPVGYPLGRWGEAPRGSAADVAFWDRWGAASADRDNDHV